MARDPFKLPGSTDPLLEPPPGPPHGRGYRDPAPRDPEPPTRTTRIPEERGWKRSGPLTAAEAASLDQEIDALSALVSQLGRGGPHRFVAGWGNPGIPYWTDTKTGQVRHTRHELVLVERDLAIARRLRAIDMSQEEYGARHSDRSRRDWARREWLDRWRARLAPAGFIALVVFAAGSLGRVLFLVIRALLRWLLR